MTMGCTASWARSARKLAQVTTDRITELETRGRATDLRTESNMSGFSSFLAGHLSQGCCQPPCASPPATRKLFDPRHLSSSDPHRKTIRRRIRSRQNAPHPILPSDASPRKRHPTLPEPPSGSFCPTESFCRTASEPLALQRLAVDAEDFGRFGLVAASHFQHPRDVAMLQTQEVERLARFRRTLPRGP